MAVPSAKCGLVIGKGGETIKQINSESGAHCELSRDANMAADEKVFVIKGNKRQIEHAKHLIRIKVGDVAPNTPFRDDSMSSMQSPYGGQVQNSYVGQNAWNANSGIQAAAQNPYQASGGWQQNSAYVQQPVVAASNPYAQNLVQAQQQIAYQQPQVVQQAAQTAQVASSASTSAVNPVTGEQDYSAQWMEYYKRVTLELVPILISIFRSIGAHDKAEAVEVQMKQKKAEAAARAAGSAAGLLQQVPIGMAVQQMGAQAGIQSQGYPAYSAATGTVAYQPQQYGQYQ